MAETTLTCPHCGQVIPLSDALTHQLSAQMEREAAQKLASAQKQFEKQLQEEKQKLWLVAQEKAKEKVDTDLKDLQEEFKRKSQLLEEAQKNELDLRKKTRELEEQRQKLDLELQRKLDEERARIIEETKKQEAEGNRLKMLEKEKQIEIMKKTIEDLRRQSEQGSMQIQGEVQENDLRQLLQQHFPHDSVSDVPTGVKGADLVHSVYTPNGQKVGVLLWESKNTKAWSQEWISKLKHDQTLAKADICLLVSRVLPEGIAEFGLVQGVWVLSPQHVVALTTTLRHHLIELTKVKQSLVGRDEKMEVVYRYLSGTQFKNRVEAIVTAFSSLQTDLESERRAMERIWRKRGQEIERVIENTAGFYGDLQGLMGTSLATIQALELDPGEPEPSTEASSLSSSSQGDNNTTPPAGGLFS